MNKDHTVLAVACGDGSIRIFDVVSMREFQRIDGHQLSVNCVRFHPEDNYLLSGGKDAHLKIW